LLFLRCTIGVIFFTHGYPKLTQASVVARQMFVEHGLPAQLVYVAGVLETFGGLMLIAGLFTRAAGLLFAAEMAVAIVKVHSSHGIMALREYEFPLALAAAALALATAGAGVISMDHLLFDESKTARSRPAKAKK
jgi:putative oxidoreductase